MLSSSNTRYLLNRRFSRPPEVYLPTRPSYRGSKGSSNQTQTPTDFANPALTPAEWVTQHLSRPATGKPFLPDPLQTQVLNSSANRLALLCCRQYGKTAIMALKTLHRLVHTPGTIAVVLSVTERQSGILLQKLRHFAQQIGLPFTARLGPPIRPSRRRATTDSGVRITRPPTGRHQPHCYTSSNFQPEGN